MECIGGLSSVRRCRSRSADLGGFLQKLQEAERALEAAAVQGRSGTELLDVRQCSRSDPEEWSWPGARWRCRSSPEKKTVAAAVKS